MAGISGGRKDVAGTSKSKNEERLVRIAFSSWRMEGFAKSFQRRGRNGRRGFHCDPGVLGVHWLLWLLVPSA
jgi:hypothetical protein